MTTRTERPRPLRARFTAALMLIAAATLTAACDTGVTESDEPGVLRVTLQADPSDNSITVSGQTYEVDESDLYSVTIFQGKVYQDTAYATLYSDLDAFEPADVEYDLLQYDNNDAPVEHVIFESFVPPGEYDMLQFGVTATIVQVENLTIPVQLPPDVSPLLEFERNIEVFEHDTTVVQLTIKPFESVVRFRDSFRFTREIEVAGISHR